MDKTLIRRRFARSVRSYAEYARAQQMIAGRMCAMLRPLLSDRPADVLEIGCGTGTFTRLFMQHFHPARMTLIDICPEVREALTDILATDYNGPAPNNSAPSRPQECVTRFVCGDAEHCDLPGGQSLIASCSVMQWFEDPERFIRRCHDLLAPGGILALSTFGPDNLHEIRSITSSGLDYPPLERLRQMLSSAGLVTVTAEEESIVLDFPSTIEVLRHLKHTGVNGITRTSWTPARLARFSDEYMLRFGTPDGNVTLTYHPVYLIARHPIREHR